MGTWNIERRGIQFTASHLQAIDDRHLQLIGLQEAQHFNFNRGAGFKLVESRGWNWERSTCNRAVLLWRGPWKSALRHRERGHRYTIAWFRPAAVVCLYLPHAEEGKRGEEEECAREFRETLEEIHRRLAERRREHP